MAMHGEKLSHPLLLQTDEIDDNLDSKSTSPITLGSPLWRREYNSFAIITAIRKIPWLVRVFTAAVIFIICVALLGSAIHHRPTGMPKNSATIEELIRRLTWAANETLPPEIDSSQISQTYLNGSFPNKLGKSLLILDVDTRAWTRETLDKQEQMTWGRLNHYIYAKIHGYDYKHIQVYDSPTDLSPPWVKVKTIRDMLRAGYQYVVFTDSDVMFPHMKLPIEYLLERWNVTSEIAVTLGLAPDLPSRHDRIHHKIISNTGFMIVQKTSLTEAIFQDWIDCPTEVKFKGCKHWKKELWHEQSAYSDYIRYEYQNHMREVPCNEVNGAPEQQEQGAAHCDGLLVRHYWVAKEKLKNAVKESLGELLWPSMMHDLIKDWVDV